MEKILKQEQVQLREERGPTTSGAKERKGWSYAKN
jgi:hypothetical protein